MTPSRYHVFMTSNVTAAEENQGSSSFLIPHFDQPLHSIEDLGGNAILRLQRERLRSIRADDRDRVGVDVETGIVSRDVVRDDQIGVFLLALFSRARHHVLRLG